MVVSQGTVYWILHVAEHNQYQGKLTSCRFGRFGETYTWKGSFLGTKSLIYWCHNVGKLSHFKLPMISHIICT